MRRTGPDAYGYSRCQFGSPYIGWAWVFFQAPEGSEDTENPDDVVTVMNPVTLVISEGSCAPEPCVFPKNPGFELGNADFWENVQGQIETGNVYEGTYAWTMAYPNFNLEQTHVIQTPLTAPTDVTMTCRAYNVDACGNILLEIKWYDSGDTLIDSVQLQQIAWDIWTLYTLNATIPTNAAKISIHCSSPNLQNLIVDNFTFDPCL